jgi:hypothetical protein
MCKTFYYVSAQEVFVYNIKHVNSTKCELLLYMCVFFYVSCCIMIRARISNALQIPGSLATVVFSEAIMRREFLSVSLCLVGSRSCSTRENINSIQM